MGLKLRPFWYAAKALWAIAKYDQPEDYVIVTRWRGGDGRIRTGLTCIGEYTDLAEDLRRWSISGFMAVPISSNREFAEKNKEDGFVK